MTVCGLAGRRRPLTALAATLLLVGSGCSSSGSSKPSSNRPTTSARLEISSPAPNAVTGRAVEVVLRLDHARVVPRIQTGGLLRPDRGHIHISVDGNLVAMPFRLTERIPDLSPGSHTVQAEFVASDHLPFANRVVAAVTFRVR